MITSKNVVLIIKPFLVRNFHSRKLAKMTPQNFDAFFVLDFEATCLKNEVIRPQEIIEFPCLKVNPKTFAIESRFHHYVRPVHHPELSHFCVELTGITQDTVQEAHEFSHVMNEFKAWLDKEAPNNFAFVTCGDWDLKTMLPAQCQLLGIQPPECMKNWINIKKSFHSATGTFPRGLEVMLKTLGLTFEGRLHSGLDDSTNIVRIMLELAKRGCVFKNNGQ